MDALRRIAKGKCVLSFIKVMEGKVANYHYEKETFEFQPLKVSILGNL